MRLNLKSPSHWDKKIKYRFAFLPVTVEDHVIWLEVYKSTYEYCYYTPLLAFERVLGWIHQYDNLLDGEDKMTFTKWFLNKFK